MNRPRLFIFLGLCVLLPHLVQAQEPQERVTNLTFTAMGWERELPAVHYAVAGRYTSLHVPLFARSQPQTYSGPARVAFYEPDATSGKPAERRLLGEVVLPAGTARVLLLFIPGGDGAWSIFPLPENEDSFPPGHARLFNTTRLPLMVKSRDGQAVSLPPNGQALLSGNGINLGLQVAWQKNGDWQLAANGIFSLKPSARRTIFLTLSDSDYFKVRTMEGTTLAASPIQMVTLSD
jgi:hypothetical protein